MTIDWNAPLEAYHPDGRVVEVVLRQSRPQPDRDHHYMIDVAVGGWVLFFGDGECVGKDNPWRIRNRTEKPAPQCPPELVERIRKLLHCIGYKSITSQENRDEARAILADLPQPVDPDEAMAREVAREYSVDDASPILAAIKRVRSETLSNAKGEA